MDDRQTKHRERRATGRYYPVDLDAEVQDRQRRSTACRIRNICRGGVLLEPVPPGATLTFRSGERLDLGIDVPGVGKIRSVIEVLYRLDDSLGARFVELFDDAEKQLSRLLEDARRVSAAERANVDNDPDCHAAREILQRLTQKRIAPLLEALLENVVEDLWHHAERAGSDSDRARFSSEVAILAQAMRERELADSIRQELLGALAADGSSGRTPVPEHRFGETACGDESLTGNDEVFDALSELSLIDNADLDIWLAKLELVKRLEEELHDILDELRDYSAAWLQSSNAPLDPGIVAESVEHTLAGLGLGTDLQRLALQAVSRHLGRDLGGFYRELVKAWNEAGLTRPQPRPRRGAPAAASTTADRPPATGQEAEDVGPVSSHSAPLPNGSPRGRGSRAPYANPEQIADLLAGLPAEALSKTGDDAATEGVDAGLLHRIIHRWLSRTHAQSARGGSQRRRSMGEGATEGVAGAAESALVSPQIRGRLDAAARMLHHMRDDPLTPAGLKSLIAPLSPRLLALAVAQSTGLNDEQQPLTALLNRLEHLALFMLSREAVDPATRVEYDEIVAALRASDPRDTAQVAKLAARAARVEAATGREYQKNIARCVAVCESREAQRLAREAVAERLNTAFGGQRVHRIVEDLLSGGWQNLLEVAGANQGLDSASWCQYWETLQRFVRATLGPASGVPATTEAEDMDTVALRTQLEQGLAYVGTDPLTLQELLDRVETALRRVLARLDRPDDYLEFTVRELVNETEDTYRPTHLPESDWRSALAKIDELRLGTLVWMGAEGQRLAFRMIWRNAAGSRLALADTMGQKVKILHRARLAAAIARGRANAVESPRRQLVTRAADVALDEMQQRVLDKDTTDPLTGLANQRRLLARLTQRLLAGAEPGGLHAAVLLEIDRFDTLTGTFGYSAGEQILGAVSGLLAGLDTKAAEYLAFLGANRFALLRQVTDRAQALTFAESLRAALAALPCVVDGHPIHLSASIGVHLLNDSGASAEHVLSAVKVATLAARREGGDRVILFDEHDEIIVRQLEYMRERVRAENAIKAGQRKLRYQPIVPLDESAGLRPHCEILLSVFDDQGVALPLISFIAAAEAFNMMREVDRQVIAQTFDWMQAHPREVQALGGVAINLSGQSLSDLGLVAFIREGIEQRALDVGRISFEVTETAAIVNLDQAAALLEELKALGCAIALDDFGSGMSSYSYLKRLPVDFVKIDGSFIKDILNNCQDREIVRSFNEIAHFMGKKTIAEYVESQEIADLLREMGVDYAQGFGIQKPRLIEEFVLEAPEPMAAPVRSDPGATA